MPPATRIGTLGSARITMRASGSVAMTPTCPPPSVPCATTTSAPASAARFASPSVSAWCIKSAPASWTRLASARRSYSGRGHAVAITRGRAATTASTCSSSAPKSNKFRPNGRSVSERIFSTAARMASEDIEVTPNVPRPPAPLTAATSSAVVAPDIPPRTIGWRMPSSSVSRVLIMAAPSGAER